LMRWSEDTPGIEDIGLRHNAKEFEDALKACLMRGIAKLSTLL
jgi:hypothetical protein